MLYRDCECLTHKEDNGRVKVVGEDHKPAGEEAQGTGKQRTERHHHIMGTAHRLAEHHIHTVDHLREAHHTGTGYHLHPGDRTHRTVGTCHGDQRTERHTAPRCNPRRTRTRQRGAVRTLVTRAAVGRAVAAVHLARQHRAKPCTVSDIHTGYHTARTQRTVRTRHRHLGRTERDHRHHRERITAHHQ